LFSQELEFLPLFIMLVHVALFRTKIVVTHITICGIVLQLFAAAWTSYWHIQCYYQLSIYLRSIESLLLWYTLYLRIIGFVLNTIATNY